MKPKLSLGQSQIQDGDVICFQVELPEKQWVHSWVFDYPSDSRRIHDLESRDLYTTPVQYYNFLQNRVVIMFRPKFEDPDPDTEFSLALSKKQNYDIVRDYFILLIGSH
jgi:ubiquitin carboxyl-terminal hydrolase 7